MPIYEFACRGCGHRFEEWVRKEHDLPPCPSCQEKDHERLISLPRVHSETTHALSMRAARARDKSQANERMHAQREYELSHDD